MTRSRQPSAPAVASVSDAGAVGPTDCSVVVDPANGGHAPDGAAVTVAAVVGATLVVLDAASFDPPP